MIENVINVSGFILKLAFGPAPIVLLLSLVALGALNLREIRSNGVQRLVRFASSAAIISAAIVLLSLTFLGGAMWSIMTHPVAD